jgi:hypothetical protein
VTVARLACNVALRNPSTGSVEIFTPESNVPGWAAEAINNPDVWAAEKPAPTVEATEPPRAGAGSGRDAWVAYAESVGVSVTEDMGRDDIVAAVDEG